VQERQSEAYSSEHAGDDGHTEDDRAEGGYEAHS
jgi:hypothetical protein